LRVQVYNLNLPSLCNGEHTRIGHALSAYKIRGSSQRLEPAIVPAIVTFAGSSL
jgi:hypothetical protein